MVCEDQVLKKKGVAETFLVTESKALIGGNISTVKNDEGFMWENGPNSFQPGDPMLRMTVRFPCARRALGAAPVTCLLTTTPCDSLSRRRMRAVYQCSRRLYPRALSSEVRV